MENCNNVPKVPFDPGWNDPPKLAYNAQQTTPGKTRKILNKRVAFPLTGSSSPSLGLTPPVNQPPMCPASLIPVPSPPKLHNPTTNLNSNSNIVIDSESTIAEVKTILLEFLENSSELGPKGNDIKKRIGAMEEMWNNGKLNTQVQALMKDLAYALKNDEPSKADDIHRALMVDHVSAVGTWMPGIKQLIHHCIARSELLALDKE